MISYIMNGFYINLTKRKDRNTHMLSLKESYSFFKNIERIDAVYHKNGHIGCASSHKKALETCLTKDDDHFLICEDDLCILNQSKFLHFSEEVSKIINENWDVIILTPRGDPINENINALFSRINNNQTTTGYVIKKSAIPLLITSLTESIEHLTKGGHSDLYAFDQYWKRLQKKLRFYYFKKIYAGQLPGHSDIQGGFADYNKRYLKQK